MHFSLARSIRRRLIVGGATLLFCAGSPLLRAQYDKVAALGSDSSITPVGGPAGSPPVETGLYDLPDFRPTGYTNDHLPSWLKFGLEERFRFEGYTGSAFKNNNSDSYMLNRLRVGIEIKPTVWFRLVGQVQDARPFLQKPPIGPPNENRWDLKLAYAEFGNAETGPLSIKVGRQELDYNNTILANSEWRNQGRAYDAVVGNLHIDRFRVGVFAASVVTPLSEGISHRVKGNDIYGIYAGIDRFIPHSALEPFVLKRVLPSASIENGGKVKTGKVNEEAYGVRLRGTGISNFDYRAEVIKEAGTIGTNDINAWAATFGAGYRFATIGWKPRAFAGYDYASGDKNSKDGTHGTFDTMYPTAHDRFGISDQFGWQNIVATRGGVEFRPHRRFSVTGQYLDFWLAKATDGVYNTSGGSIVRDTKGTYGTHVGEEFDFYTWYEINREIHIGAGVAHLMPGRFLANNTQGASYTTPYFALELLDGRRVH
jgi:hypothetical protein